MQILLLRHWSHSRSSGQYIKAHIRVLNSFYLSKIALLLHRLDKTNFILLSNASIIIVKPWGKLVKVCTASKMRLLLLGVVVQLVEWSFSNTRDPQFESSYRPFFIYFRMSRKEGNKGKRGRESLYFRSIALKLFNILGRGLISIVVVSLKT